MAKPIFILGKHRSGTTWLANQLCQHPNIAGVQHSMHHGIHESAYFSNVVGRYGDIRQRQNFIEFVEVMKESDYFNLAGASDKKYLYSLFKKGYGEIFRDVMDRFAYQNNADMWVEKSPKHTLHARKIAKLFPDAKFISIKRTLKEYLESSIGLKNLHTHKVKQKKRKIIKHTIARVYYNKVINKLSKIYPKRNINLTYEELKNNQQRTFIKVVKFLGVEFTDKLLESHYAPNTSFSSKKKYELLTKTDYLIALFSHILGSCIPLFIWDLKERLADKRNQSSLPSWFFKIYDEDLHNKT